jgi:trigger factor
MTIDTSQLRVSVEEKERWRRVMSVTVPATVVRAEEERAAAQLASRARMKGFRKGRVPKRLIEGRFGGALRQEALDKLIQSAYRGALAAEQLRPISEGEVADLQYQPDQDLTFDIAFDVEPVIEVSRVGGFVVERATPAVTDEQVERVLARVQEQNGVWKPIEEGTPQERDLVSVEILRLDDDTDPVAEADVEAEVREYDFVIGQGDALPDIEAAIKTLEPGASGEFDVTFPDDFPDESRRGDVERVRIELKGRRVMDVPLLDDDLAKQVGDFATLDELKARIREDMEKEATESAENGVRSRLLDLLIEANSFDVPASMVDRYAETVIGRAELPPERLAEVKEQIRPEAERAVKRILVLDRVAETQGLTATEEELDARIEEIAGRNDTTAAKVYAELQKAGRLEALERELTEAKVFEFLKEQSKIIDAPAA